MAGRCKAKTVAWQIQFPDITSSPINWSNLTLSNSLEKHDLETGAIDPRIVGLIGAITQTHTITISALRSDHSMYASSGNVSNHYYGRAMDIAVVDGVPCTDVAPDAPCGRLGETLAHLTGPSHPTELIYCFDLDGPGPGLGPGRSLRPRPRRLRRLSSSAASAAVGRALILLRGTLYDATWGRCFADLYDRAVKSIEDAGLRETRQQVLAAAAGGP